MQDLINNPLFAATELIDDRYNQLVRDTLAASELSDDTIGEIAKSLQVDKRLFLTLNRKYEKGTSFREFWRRCNISTEVQNKFSEYTHLYAHQEQAIQSILGSEGTPPKDTVIATGTGSGKTEAFLLPIMEDCLRHQIEGVQAIIIYPMNALANDQIRRIGDKLRDTKLTFACYTGATPNKFQEKILQYACQAIIL